MKNTKLAMKERLKLFRKLFVGRPDAYAIATETGMTAVREELTDTVLADHLAGRNRVATYLPRENGRTPVLVFDVDIKSRKIVRKLLARLRKCNVRAYVERSKSKGFHVWVFLDRPLRAVLVRKFAKHILRGRLDNPKIEIFPKQDEVPAGRVGSCISLPLSGQYVKSDRTVFLDKSFNPLSKQWRFLMKLKPTPANRIIRACRELESAQTAQLADTPPKNTRASGGPIPEGERNNVLTSLAGAMRHQGATHKGILAALKRENSTRCEPPLSDREVESIAASVSRYAPAESHTRDDSQATRLLALAGDIKLLHTPDQEAFGRVEVNGHRETLRLRDPIFRRMLARRYYESTRSAASFDAVRNALAVLESRALFDGSEEEVHTRMAYREGAIYLDLCDPTWRAVKITAEGWKLVSKPRVRFRRTRGMRPLPIPVRNGSVSELRPFLNVGTEADFVLVLAWLVAALSPRGPYPLLVLQGEAGSAKSTAARVLRQLIDPNTTPLRAEPRDTRDLMIAAMNSWCIAFDNVSRMTPWLSDALCRLATGGGFSTRELYSDDQEKLFDAQRPVLLNGIEGVVSRGDLVDRSIVIFLPVITHSQRKPERTFWRSFHRAQPRIFGAILDAVSCALRRLPEVKLEQLPRMADFAQWVVAAEPKLGWSDGTFMRAYGVNRSASNTLALEASIIVPALRKACPAGSWSGTAAQLLTRLVKNAGDEKQNPGWPKTPWSLSIQLRQIAHNLRAEGLDVQLGEKTPGAGSRRIITITWSKEARAGRPIHHRGRGAAAD